MQVRKNFVEREYAGFQYEEVDVVGSSTCVSHIMINYEFISHMAFSVITFVADIMRYIFE